MTPRAGLDAQHSELQRAGENERGAERRMSGKRQLSHRREDPHLHVPVALGRIHERRLGVVQLLREPLQRLLGNLARVGEDRELVPGERRVGEDVADDVAE